MKKLYSLITAVIIGFSASAETITLTEDGQLASAVASAAAGDVIELAANQTISSRLNITDKNITIQGTTPDIAIVRAQNFNNNSVLLINNKSNVTIKNLTCDGSNVSASRHYLEAAGNATVILENVKFINATTSTENNGIVKTIQSSILTVNSCSFTNCTVPENNGNIFIGNTNATVSGNTSTSFLLEKRITATDYTGNSDIYLKADAGFTAGVSVVLGATEGFTLKGMSADYSLEANNGNLVLTYNAVVALNEATGQGYSSFMAAYNALAPVDGVNNVVISVRENADVTDRLMNPNNTAYTVVGISPDITLTRTFNNKLFVSNAKNMGFENLTIDCNSCPNSQYEFQANQNNNTLSLKDVKILNSKSTQGIFDVKEGNRILSLNNVTVEGFDGAIGVNLNGKLRLEGNNVIPAIRVANAGAEISATGALTNTTPINIIYADGLAPKAGDTVVKGCTDPSKFSIDGMTLQTVDGNLVVGSSSAIDDIAVDEEKGEAVYFNLNGVVVNPENLAPGLYIRRQGSKVTKIVIK